MSEPNETAPALRPLAARAVGLLGVVPVESGQVPVWESVDQRLGARLVAYEDVAALVCHAPPAGAEADPLYLTERHWEVHRALLRGDIVPSPAGIVFADDAEVVAFLTESYATLRGALARMAGRWEFRLHIGVTDPAFPEAKALDLATHIYAELRRLAGSAIPTPVASGGVLSAAFLVDRATSPAFRDRVEQLSRLNSALELDLTGPWPAYDFVRMYA